MQAGIKTYHKVSCADYVRTGLALFVKSLSYSMIVARAYPGHVGTNRYRIFYRGPHGFACVRPDDVGPLVIDGEPVTYYVQHMKEKQT